ncbi:MAG: Fe-S cluster assembly protein SufD [Paracoccaceae bacterium]
MGVRAKITSAKPVSPEGLIGARRAPAGATWANKARREALARLRAMGLPTRRDEYWKFTDPASLVLPEAPPAKTFVSHEPEVFGEIDRLRLIFVDGVFDAQSSDDLKMSGLEIELLDSATTRDIHWAQSLFGVLEARGQTPIQRPLAALNSAFANNGVVIRAVAPVARPVTLIYRHGRDNSDVMLHHVIRVEKGASLTLLENGPAAARLNCVKEVEVADGATFHHVRTQGRDHERRAVTHMFARVGENSTFKSFTLTANGALTRNEVVVDLVGDNATANVAGAAVGDGAFHHDDTVFITHAALAGESRQVFKKVLRNGATGVFQGKILVRSGAQKTDGYQISQALLLDGDSQFLAKPELEIYADDVVCSHGSTSGAIDEEALYYLRARGIPRHKAQDLLVLAFLAQAIEEIDDPDIADDIRMRLEAWLYRHRA